MENPEKQNPVQIIRSAGTPIVISPESALKISKKNFGKNSNKTVPKAIIESAIISARRVALTIRSCCLAPKLYATIGMSAPVSPNIGMNMKLWSL